MKYLLIDEIGGILSAYDSELNEKIPVEAVEVTEDLWTQRLDGDFNCYKDGQLSKEDFRSENDIKKDELNRHNIEYEKKVAALTAGVPYSEIQTWTKQEAEARAYLADDTSSTPLIDSLAATRGVDKDVLVGKIIAKADAYAVAIGRLTGLRQKVEDEIGINS